MKNAPGSGTIARDRRVSSRPDSFESGRALDHAERLAYPRRVGSSLEGRAARYVLGTFAGLGLVVRREPFPVPYVAREVGVRVVFGACAALVLLGMGLVAARPLAAAICWAFSALVVNAPWRVARGIGTRWPTRLMSANLVATLPGDGRGEAPARVVFMAHYDTKSQVLPTGIRVGLVVAVTAVGGGLAAWTLAASAFGLEPVGTAIPAVLSLAMLAALAANVTGNRSAGALDNGSGLGTLLEIARTWRPRPGEPIEALWVATGAEEVGLDGARDFLRRHESWWRRKPTLLVNLDSVGAGDRLYLAGEPAALRLAQETADGLGLPWARLRVLGAGMDHEPFAARGLAAVSLLGDVVGASLAVHSIRDTTALVDRAALERAGTLAAHIAWAWAERHRSGERQDGPGPVSVEGSAHPAELAVAVG